MTGYSFGDVVLVPFPFTDQTGSKQRPTVVVSSTHYHRERPDLLLMPITSQVPSTARFGDVAVCDIRTAGLIKDGVIKPVVFTIEAKLVRKKLRRLVDDDQRALRHAIAQLIG
jgi:mRNA interferase MazF